jgi:hypothetical protein
VSAAWLEEAKDPVYGLFLATVAVCLIRAPNQPSVDVGAAGTTLSITPSDVLLLALLAAVLRVLVRDGLPPRGSRLVLAAAGAFGLWLFASSIPNGATATVAAAKLLELGVLTLAAAVLIDRAARLAPLLVVITAMTVVAPAVAAVGGR